MLITSRYRGKRGVILIKKINIVRALLILAMALLNILLIFQVREMKEKYTCVSVRLATDVTKKQLCKYLEKEETKLCKIENVTAFSQAKVLLKGKDLGRQLHIDAYCVYGKVEDVLPLSLVAGNLLIREDTNGCILTKDAAYELFGTIDAIGLEVIINNRTYVVRGVISSNVEAVLYEARFDEDTFQCLEFQISDENGEYYAKQFLSIYGLFEDSIIGENYLVKIAQNLCLFPFLIFMIYFIIFMDVKAKQYKISKGFRIGFLAINLVLIIVLGKQIGYFPKRWIPSKWSDFSHYGYMIEDLKQQLKLLIFAKPFAKEVALRIDLVKTAVLFVGAVFGLCYILRNLNEWVSKAIDKYFEGLVITQQKLLEEEIDENEIKEIEELEACTEDTSDYKSEERTEEIIEERTEKRTEEKTEERTEERMEERIEEKTEKRTEEKIEERIEEILEEIIRKTDDVSE